MAEYWVSKKQYWCKYCNIFVRDDAPSRRLHETGLKHQGGKERFLRDLYKTGEKAKRDKEVQAREMAMIEASAAAAYAHDTLSGAPPRQSTLSRLTSAATASSSKPKVAGPPKDKWANYSTASQLGFDDAETQKTSYEIEQELKGRSGEPGQWEEIKIPVASWNGASKRKMEAEGEEEEAKNFKFQHRDKAAVNDPYDDDFDINLKLRVKEEKRFEDGRKKESEGKDLSGGLKRDRWTGKLELNVAEKGKGKEKDKVYDPDVGGWVKPEDVDVVKAEQPVEGNEGNATEEPKPDAEVEVKSEPEPPAPAANSLFKKRRPAPSARKVK
ncbi:WW domain-binding protein 4, partial [Tremellales sp. Uapishka_1]